jgi:hypothetical protein
MKTKANDITAFLKEGAENKDQGILQATAQAEKAKEPKKPGRKPKPASEKESKPITFYLKPAEEARLKEIAGSVQLATFVKMALRENIDLSSIFE